VCEAFVNIQCAKTLCRRVRGFEAVKRKYPEQDPPNVTEPNQNHQKGTL